MHKKREILLTNDDGISANGINELAKFLKNYGNVTIVAPTQAQSGKSAALSLQVPQYLNKISEEPGLKIYSFNGTPVDCIKIAMNTIFVEKHPDFIFSGINHGSNASVAALYSGTLGACIEGTIYGVPSVGFSICTHSSNPDFSPVFYFGKLILDKYFAFPPVSNVYLNINFPNIPISEIKGIRMARRGYGRWIREYNIEKDEQGCEYFWMTGQFDNLEPEDGIGDNQLLQNGYVTIVPHKIDNTDYDEILRLRDIWNIE